MLIILYSGKICWITPALLALAPGLLGMSKLSEVEKREITRNSPLKFISPPSTSGLLICLNSFTRAKILSFSANW